MMMLSKIRQTKLGKFIFAVGCLFPVSIVFLIMLLFVYVDIHEKWIKDWTSSSFEMEKNTFEMDFDFHSAVIENEKKSLYLEQRIDLEAIITNPSFCKQRMVVKIGRRLKSTWIFRQPLLIVLMIAFIWSVPLIAAILQSVRFMFLVEILKNGNTSEWRNHLN